MAEGLACFTFLRDQAPVWIAEVAELEKHVAARQAEITQLPANLPKPKLKKSGSNESIRPGREDQESDAYQDHEHAVDSMASTESPVSVRYGFTTGAVHAEASSAPARQQDEPPSSEFERMPRKRKTASVLSNATAPPKYRSRSMIIVYYDSIVQASFERLVRHVTVAKNTVRKAKMAARIEAMAALENDEEDSEEGDEDDIEYNTDGGGLPPIPVGCTSIHYKRTLPAVFRSARSMAPAISASTASQDRPANLGDLTPDVMDVFEQADKLLDEAQSQCESGAHQFLRDGDCDGHMVSAKQSFAEIMALSEREIPRFEEERSNTRRRSEQRRNRGSIIKFGPAEMTDPKESSRSIHLGMMGGPIEANDDDDDDDNDDDDEEMEMPSIPSARHRGTARSLAT